MPAPEMHPLAAKLVGECAQKSLLDVFVNDGAITVHEEMPPPERKRYDAAGKVVEIDG